MEVFLLAIDRKQNIKSNLRLVQWKNEENDNVFAQYKYCT